MTPHLTIENINEKAGETEIPDLTGGSPKSRPQVNLIHVLEEYNWGKMQDSVVAPLMEVIWV